MTVPSAPLPETQAIPPVGQTAWALFRARGVPIQVIKADAFYVQWRSRDLQQAGNMSAGRWNEMRAAQQEAINQEWAEVDPATPRGA